MGAGLSDRSYGRRPHQLVHDQVLAREGGEGIRVDSQHVECFAVKCGERVGHDQAFIVHTAVFQLGEAGQRIEEPMKEVLAPERDDRGVTTLEVHRGCERPGWIEVAAAVLLVP